MLASNVKVIQPKKLFNIEESARQLLRVAGYARVSTGRPEQKTSFESQQKHYKELVSKHSDWIDVGLYADEGITATSMRKRKQFLKMIQDAKDGKIDRIIVKSVSRFARNTVDCLATVEELTALGVDVFFELQNLSSLQDSKTTRMQLTMYASMAQEESETLSESVAYGIREGIKNGRYRAPKAYGYRLDENKRLLFTPKILSDMFDRFGDDIRIRKIDDNTYTVDVAVQVSKTFFAWIVGTQGKVKIKAPEKVVTEFSDFVAKIKEVY